MRIDRLSVLSRFPEWWCMAAFGRWSDLFGWFRQRTRSKLSSRSQNCFFIKSSLEASFGCVSSYLWWASSLQDSLLFAQGEILGNSRSVMLLNVLGDTRTTMSVRTRFPKFLFRSCLIQKSGETPESHRPNWDRGLQLLVAQRGMSRRRSSSNCADYVPAICTHRPSLFPMMVQYRWSDRWMFIIRPKVHRYFFNRGSKSRNKVAVGEPAAGSFSESQQSFC